LFGPIGLGKLPVSLSLVTKITIPEKFQGDKYSIVTMSKMSHSIGNVCNTYIGGMLDKHLCILLIQKFNSVDEMDFIQI
jgi:hypothetical protein